MHGSPFTEQLPAGAWLLAVLSPGGHAALQRPPQERAPKVSERLPRENVARPFSAWPCSVTSVKPKAMSPARGSKTSTMWTEVSIAIEPTQMR